MAVQDPLLLPADGAAYPQVLRTEGYAWWRSLLGALVGLSLFGLLTAVVSQLIVRLVWTITQPVDYRTYYTQAFAFERPVGMVASNLGIITLIPISLVLMLVVHQVRPRWLFSVRPGIRWRYLLVCLGVAVATIGGVQAVSSVVEGVPGFAMQEGFWAFLVVIVLLSPLQAAAEEIFFRGYLLQALGSVVARPWFGVVGSALVFALMHGTQNLPLFCNRLAFGLLAGLLVWRVGGIEAGIAAHVINNVVAYVYAGLTTSFAALKAVRELTWTASAIQVAGFAVFVLLALLVARLMRLRTTVDRSAVEAQAAPA